MFKVEKNESSNTLTIKGCDKKEMAGGKVNIPSEINGLKVTSIGNSAFAGCWSLMSIEIPNSVISIEELAFLECSLASIIIPNSVTSIDSSAFWECSLKSIVVEKDNPIYDSRNNCNAIIETSTNELIVGCQNTIIPKSVTSIKSDSFTYCPGLTNITIPNSVTNIGSDAFFNCGDLIHLTLGNGLTTIEDGAFEDCSSLASIMLPNSVTSMEKHAFCSCSSLTSIVVEKDNPIYDSRNNCNAIIETSTNELIVGCQNTIIPEGVTSIGEYAFFFCSSLTSITIPDGVTSLGDYAFSKCSSLESITIPDSVTSIGEGAFADCQSLKDIYYTGTEEQWNVIEKSIDENETLENVSIHFNWKLNN